MARRITCSSTRQRVRQLSGMSIIRCVPEVCSDQRFRVVICLAAKDFNNDGKPDYLLYHLASRRTAIWYLSGSVIQASRFGPTIAAGFSFVGAADFDGDGNLDLVLFNPGNHKSAIWYLSGTASLLTANWDRLSILCISSLAQLISIATVSLTLCFTILPRGKRLFWALNNNVLRSGKLGPVLPAGYTLAAP